MLSEVNGLSRAICEADDATHSDLLSNTSRTYTTSAVESGMRMRLGSQVQSRTERGVETL